MIIDSVVIYSVESGPALDHECIFWKNCFHSDDYSKAEPNREAEIW